MILPQAMSIPVSKLDLIVEMQFWRQVESSLFIVSPAILLAPSVHTANLLEEFGRNGRQERSLIVGPELEGGREQAGRGTASCALSC